MNRDEAKRFFQGLSPSRRGLFLAQLAHDLTVAARGYYKAAGQVDERLQQKGLEGLNEVQHRLSAQFRRLLGDPKAGFPNDVMMDVIFDWAESAGVRGDLVWAIERAASGDQPDLPKSLKART